MADTITAPCGTNHELLDQATRRKHYHSGCKDLVTRKAVSDFTAENKAAKLAAAQSPVTAAAPVTTPTGYVDHFKDTAPLPVPTTARPVPTPPAPTPPGTAATRSDVSSTGGARRLRAVTNLGWTPKELATATTLSPDSIWWLLIAPPARIHERTDRLITDAFARLRLEPKTLDGSTTAGQAATRARALAELHDWAGPFDYENIDVATERPNSRPTKRDPIALAEAIAQAKLDEPTLEDPNVELARRVAALTEQLGVEQRVTEQVHVDLKKAQVALHQQQQATKNVEAARELAEAEISRLTEQLSGMISPAGIGLTLSSVLSNEPLMDARPTDDLSISIDPTPDGGIRLTLPSSLLAR